MTSTSTRMAARAVASAVVPDAGKRAIDRVRAHYLLRRVLPLNDDYVRRFGLEVRRGPFEGMRYPDVRDPVPGHLIAKLVGSYERQIYSWLLDEWITGDVELVIDVGCAEGFYAVGLARALPRAQVHAYDTYEPARNECARLAQLNGVQDRVVIGETCTPSTLARVSHANVALLCDCEGYEKTLLDPSLAPNLRDWSIIVEQHDHIDSSIATTIEQRFRHTHEIEVIGYEPADASSIPELSWMSERQAGLVVNERPPSMTWALLRPREAAS
jgi:precorrin-6B methylase 2